MKGNYEKGGVNSGYYYYEYNRGIFTIKIINKNQKKK